MNWKRIGDVVKQSAKFTGNYIKNGRFFRDSKTFAQKAKDKGVPWGIRASTIMGLALPTRVAARTGKTLFKASSIILGQAAKRPMATTAAGITGMGIVGGIRGGYRAWRNQEPRRDMNQPAQPVVGPGYTTWSKPRGMGANNLGANGGLTLALGRMRHR